MITGKTLYDSYGKQFYPYCDAEYVSSGVVVDTNMLKDDQIVKVLMEDAKIENKVKKLIVKCNNRGGTDNISIAYLEKKEG